MERHAKNKKNEASRSLNKHLYILIRYRNYTSILEFRLENKNVKSALLDKEVRLQQERCDFIMHKTGKYTLNIKTRFLLKLTVVYVWLHQPYCIIQKNERKKDLKWIIIWCKLSLLILKYAFSGKVCYLQGGNRVGYGTITDTMHFNDLIQRNLLNTRCIFGTGTNDGRLLWKRYSTVL